MKIGDLIRGSLYVACGHRKCFAVYENWLCFNILCFQRGKILLCPSAAISWRRAGGIWHNGEVASSWRLQWRSLRQGTMM